MNIKALSAASIIAVALLGGCTSEATKAPADTSKSDASTPAADMAMVTLELPGMT